MFGTRIAQALVLMSSLWLGGCAKLLGDFTYDADAEKRGGHEGGGLQGDIFITPPDGLVTTEQGAKATFTIVLTREPTANVAIALSSSDETEGKVYPPAVTFTPDNWAAPQTVTVTGVDDAEPDHTQEYYIKTAPASSDDITFDGKTSIYPSLRNLDDETAGFLVTPLKGLTTTESGGEAKFSIQLTHQPKEDVVVPITSGNPAEGSVTPAMLAFTSTNWAAPQFVTVTGVDDTAADKAQEYKIINGAASSKDPDYQGLDPDDVTVTNLDNDSAGVMLTPATGLVTYEDGGMATFGIALSSPPEKGTTVTIPLTSSDLTEGTVSPDQVTFTSVNWMAPQMVTITGVNDYRPDGDQPYLIRTEPAQSDDKYYAPGGVGIDGPDAEVKNVDDDSPGMLVTPIVGLVTTEKGGSATFTVALSSKPRSDILFDVTSSRPEEGVASPAILTFTETNWQSPQEVRVTGVDDNVADGMQTYTVHVTPRRDGMDQEYLAALREIDVALSNADDDSPGITVVAEPKLTTTEGGGTATFTVVLNSQPKADVSIPLSGTDATEGTVNPPALLFTMANWAAPQVVTVRGVDDAVADGDQPYRILTGAAVSDDPKYAGIDTDNVDLLNIDNDSAGITVWAPNQPLKTSEGGGTATFTVVLNSEPTADVTIAVSSTNTAEGTVNPPQLTFTPQNWRAPQTVTVKGVEDNQTADGNQPYRITLAAAQSNDLNYKGKDPADVQMQNVDNDSAGITLLNTTNLTTRESGGTATFQIVLNSRPTADVTIGLSSSDTTEGTITLPSLKFTSANFAAPQTVIITGVNDDVADGNQVYRVITAAASSNDPNYNGRDAADANVTNIDDDSPGITVVYLPQTGLKTKEDASTASFTIALNSQPTADVTIPLSSSNQNEGIVSPASVTFTAANWRSPRTITITGVDDQVADGDQPFSVLIAASTSNDAKYKGIDAPDVPVINVDNDSAGITVSAVTGNTKEDGTTASFTIVLNSQPKSDVTIAVSSSNTKEGTVSAPSVTFTAANWAAPQKITITGADDRVADGPQPYTIDLAPATSKDAGYNGKDAPDVSLSNVDDDSAGITVTPVKGNTSEAGGTTTFTIVLNSQPTASVTIPLSSSDPNEGKLAFSQVMFTTSDYGSPKTVTITGVNDDAADGNQPYSIIIGAATSNDRGYSGLDAEDVAVINLDDDSPGLTVTPTSGSTSEKGDDFTFTIALTSKPSADVSIPLSTSDATEGTVSPPTLTFTTLNWKAPQTVKVKGVDDDEADGAQIYKIQIGAATSTDKGYSGYDDPTDIAVTNTDDDSAGITVSKAAGSTSESGMNTTFTIVLNSKPTADVTIPLSSSDEREGTVSPTTRTFTTANWNLPQTITVHGEDDKIADGDRRYSIRTGAASSTDTDYKGMDADDVDILNIDNDVAGIQVSAASGSTTEAGGTFTFTIVLNSQPTAAVSIPVESSDPAEGKLAVTTVDFTTTNWDDPQTITVTGVDDKVADGTQTYAILIGMPKTNDMDYAAIDPVDVAMKNSDNDSAGIDVTPPAMNKTETGESPSAPPVTFSVVLTSQPTAAVTIPVVSSLPTEGEVTSPANGELVFNANNWNTPQTVIITGVQDAGEVDMDQKYEITLGPAKSSDGKYKNMLPMPEVITLTNLDDDVPPAAN